MSCTVIFKVGVCLRTLRPSGFLSRSQWTSWPRSHMLRHSGTKHGPVTHEAKEAQDGTQYRSVVSSLQQAFTTRSVFSAGTAKRKAAKVKRLSLEDEDQQVPKSSLRTAEKMQPPERALSTAEWSELKASLSNPERFEVQMMITLMISGAHLDIAKSLLSFAAMEAGMLSYELLLRYLIVCANGGHHNEVLELYDIMRSNFASLDTTAARFFIKSFSYTARWREAISILHETNKVLCSSAYSYDDIIRAAMLHGAVTTAWTLYEELLKKDLIPVQDTWKSLFTGTGKTPQGEEAMSDEEQQDRLLKVLFYMRENYIYPEHSLAWAIKTWFESLSGQKWTGRWTTATPNGLCTCCGSSLDSIQLTPDEYEKLKDRVMTDIIKGQDVFTKTTPQELNHFTAFMKSKPTFDVVIDGLNVGNTAGVVSQRAFSDVLLAVVSKLESQGLNVLVLGRKHMLSSSSNWKKRNMNLIQQKAHCFFTDNISKDDPFLLYATLHSGNHCLFVSRDLMRDHKACLPDSTSRQLFFKWQRGHQLVLDEYRSKDMIRFQMIPSYDTVVQTSGCSWHIPYDNMNGRSTYEVPEKWLCLTKH
ncbi:mitochondrial ribonuclease P catalytic subunit [Thalassophryne amazonica]|uniref:mitochondrial ribonuclease P catalytic subunit n=1 Tax=Thalassophryne amazonica TaxID=390379 RepID=UPI001471FF5E|nr:mitochondrial ribonuclease P catalytic subunit [Thalassophryne amazonica]XP_034051217.1 mitochondrial ribonuclease P catalytic subunit [Thalassophryne amazonica]